MEAFGGITILDIKEGSVLSSPKNRVYCKNHLLLIRKSGVTSYDFGDEVLVLKAGDALLKVEGTSYIFKNLAEEKSDYLYFAFASDMDFKKAIKCTGLEDVLAKRFSVSPAFLWNFGTEADRLRCYALFYELLACLLDSSEEKKEDKRQKAIAPAVAYLETHIFDPELKIESLHTHTPFSATHFRNLFNEVYGKTPQKYVADLRLSYARSLLESGEFPTVAEISAHVGFSDPLYFSRAFKRCYGVSPSHYLALH